MPRRAGAVATSNGHSAIRVRGAYESVLQQVCERDAMHAAPSMLMLTDAEIPDWQRANTARAAALKAERSGKPVTVQSYMLPDGLPPPFDQWPHGGSRRTFTVDVDDTIRLRTMGAWQ